MSQPVLDYIQNRQPAWQAEICQQIHDLIHQSIPGADDRLQYGKPHYLKNGKYACVLGTAKGWVSLTVFNAQGLTPPDGLFEPSDITERRTLKIREGETFDSALLGALIAQAAATI